MISSVFLSVLCVLVNDFKSFKQKAFQDGKITGGGREKWERGSSCFPPGGGLEGALRRSGRSGRGVRKNRKKGGGFREFLFPAFRGVPVTVFQDRAGVETLARMPAGVPLEAEGCPAVGSRRGAEVEKEQRCNKKQACMEKFAQQHPVSTRSRGSRVIGPLQPSG